ncbi:MAG: hypothetical protein Q4P33_08000 [Flaviflexus sp.]|nr:hypothetical protein [Flaviflexus sp.]
MESKSSARSSYVYLLKDPRLSGKDSIFYVGKGSGQRARTHELESGDTAKLRRIAEIREAGLEVQIEYLTLSGTSLLNEEQAFSMEAALIWALREQLTNASGGNHLSFVSDRSLEISANAKQIELDQSYPVVLVWVKGIFGGTSLAGDFIGVPHEVVWENSRGYWTHSRGICEAIDKKIAQGDTVLLFSLTNGLRGRVNVVNGIFELSGVHRENVKNGKGVDVERVVFDKREGEPSQLATEAAAKYLGNELVVDGKVCCAPGRHGVAPEGQISMPRASRALYA